MTATKIEWATEVWNPVRGCSRVSEGCRNCYAERTAARFRGGTFDGFADIKATGEPRWTGRVELIPSKLDEPLRRRKPQRWFVNSMSDLFHERLSDEAIAAVFGVMAACPQHRFIVLTKRPERMRRWFAAPYRWDDATEESVRAISPQEGSLVETLLFEGGEIPWPLPNVALGVSVEDQASFDERVLPLVSTPAALRLISYEPALGPIDSSLPVAPMATPLLRPRDPANGPGCVHWLIFGGESGPGARPCNLAWARAAMRQCRAARVPFYCKQLGVDPYFDTNDASANVETAFFPSSVPVDWSGHGVGTAAPKLHHPKGGEMSEWPEDLRVREIPQAMRLEGEAT